MKNLFFAGGLLILLALGACNNGNAPENTAKEETKAKPKNILFIAVDDLKPMLGCYGDTFIQTPNIDRLAATGFVFQNNQCQQAVCAPSRASLLTGKRPDYTEVWDLKTLIRDKNPDIVTMPQYFKQLGYQTAAVGKIFDYRSVDHGADSVSWTYKFINVKNTSPIGGGYIFEKRRVSTEAPDVDDSVTIDGQVVKQTIAYLKKFAKEDKPFFMAAGFFKPHLPFVAPKKYWDMYQRSDFHLPDYQKDPVNAPAYATQPGWELRSIYKDVPNDFVTPIPEEKQLELIHGYHACVTFIDAQIGKVINALDSLGLRDNTVIVLWGDHGWHLGDHDMWCKHTNYEQAARAPLIFSYGNSIIGTTLSPTEFVDIYPTLCDLAGVPKPKNIDGLSLVPLMEGKVEKVKDYAVSQFPRGDKMGYAFRNDRYRYVVWVKNNFTTKQTFADSLIADEELYDYQADPEEKRNFAYDNEYQEIRDSMLAQAKEFFHNEEIKFNENK